MGIELNLIGKVKIVFESGGTPLAKDSNEGNIARSWVEFDDIAMPSGKTFREEMNTEPSSEISIHRKKLDKDKPLRLPVWIGELLEVTQQKGE